MTRNVLKRAVALLMALLLSAPAIGCAEIIRTGSGIEAKSTLIDANSTITLNVNDQIAVELNGRTIKSAKSSKKKVASIDKATGVITALKEGTSKIKITYTNRTRFSFKVKVIDPHKPSSLSFAQGNAVDLRVGQNVQLTPVIYPEGASTTFTWKSSRKSVAKVVNGVVTARKAGKATITATSANKKKASIVVNVLPNKADNITPAPSSSDVYAIGNNWTVRLKSVEITAGNSVVMEFYLLNGFGRSSRITDFYVDLWVNSTPLVKGTIGKVRVSCDRKSSKVFKVTFPATALVTPGLNLATYTPYSFWFNGINGYLRHRA